MTFLVFLLLMSISVQALCTSRSTVIISVLFAPLFTEVVEHRLIESLSLISFNVLKDEFIPKLEILLADIIWKDSLDILRIFIKLFFG